MRTFLNLSSKEKPPSPLFLEWSLLFLSRKRRGKFFSPFPGYDAKHDGFSSFFFTKEVPNGGKLFGDSVSPLHE